MHAAIERTGEGYVLVDLGSNNGTFVVGEKSRIQRLPLRDGDEITIGRSRLAVSLPGDPSTVSTGPRTTVVEPRTQRAAAAAAPPSPEPSPSRKPEPPSPSSPVIGARTSSDLPIVLTVVSGPDRGMVYFPNGERITIGRLTTCDVPLDDSAVSRVHAAIKRESGGYWIYDENSANGTELGSPPRRVFQSELRDGDVLRVGETEIQVDIGVGKGGGTGAFRQTMLSGTVGEKTFRMSLRGLAEHGGPRRRARPDVETRKLKPADLRRALGGPPPASPPAPPPPRVSVRVLSGPDAGKLLEPPGGIERITFGRADDVDLRLTDAGVSGLHCSIRRTAGGFELRDEGSRNGTFVGDRVERVTAVRLAGGETIRIGGSELRVEITAGPPPVERTTVMPAPGTPASPPGAKKAAAEAPPKPAGKEKKPEEILPELARSAEAKQRISKIMKGVSLRPTRMPGTTRQWASLALVLAAVVASWAIPRSWVAAGPVHGGHADIEERCETCHVAGPRLAFLSIGGAFASSLAMDASCATADCHADDLLTRADVRDDCVSCHTEHRGRRFDISGGEDRCWSCHLGGESPRDFETRPMQIAVTRDEDLRARLAEGFRQVEIGLRFSHAAHEPETRGDERYDTCVGCHAPIAEGRTFSLPGHAECIECHEKAVSADVEEAKTSAGPDCLECHTREDGDMVEVPKPPFEFVIFSHADHLPDHACKSCHARIWEEAPYGSVMRAPDLYPVVMDACYTCHRQEQATVECLDCHREHHSFAVAEAAPPPGRSGGGWNAILFVAFGLTLGAMGYTYADMRMVRRWTAPPPPPAVAKKAAPAGAKAEEPAGEILPFPKVDVEACISCSSCYNSCPKQVLAGDDHGKSTVVNPDACIAREGCAVCEQGCPTGAIRVSTAPLKRTVERPQIDEHNEANVPGLFFAGEVIGAALIKSAIHQGNDCIKYIAEKKPKIADAPYDVIIVGAGPAGLGAALSAKSRKLRYLILERDTIASTIMNYPRDKAVLAEPIKMPLGGALPMMDAEKDTLLKVWRTIITDAGLEVKEFEEVTDVRKKNGLLEVTTTKGSYQGACVLLAIGTRGNPRKLGCPGEDPSRVVYNLIDAADFAGKKVVVVGGGDSAIEAAIALAGTEGTSVLLSYRKGQFARVKPRNLEKLDEAVRAGRVEIAFSSSVKEVRTGTIVLATESGDRELECDQVFALIGADPPRGWIEKLGVPFVEREEEVVTWS